MTRSEQQYRHTITSIGIAMLFFVGFVNLLGLLVVALEIVLAFVPNETTAHVIYQVVYAAGYLAAFMIPSKILARSLKKRVGDCLPVKVERTLTPRLLLVIPASIAVVYVFAYLNSLLVMPFHYNEFMAEMSGTGASTSPQGYEILLDFVVMCMVPGFCEELLFRGRILTNLLPYGRFNAILISSLLFALMHQNIGQMLYTFVAGILLGMVYERTESIWACTILHIINNFASVAQTTLLAGIRNSQTAGTVALMLEVFIFAVGMICLGILIPTFFFPKKKLEGGVFGHELPASDTYAACPVSSKRMVALFRSPPMVVFMVLSVLQMLLLLGMAVLNG